MTIACLSPNGVDSYTLSGPPRVLMVATMDGVVEFVANTDGTWDEAHRSLEGEHVGSLMINAQTGTVFAGTHGTGLFRSTDSGLTWTRRDDDLETKHIFTLACIGDQSHSVLYAGCEPAYLYESKNDGESWQEVQAFRDLPTRPKWSFPAPPHIAHVKHVAADPRDHKVLYVCVEQGGLFKSEDGGLSFDELHFQDDTYKLNKDTHRVVFTPSDPDEIYLDGGEGIARSKDGGKTWQRIATPEMRVAYPDQLFISPDSEDTIFVVGGGTPPNIWRATGVADAAIVRTDDRGKTWQALQGGLPDLFAGNIEAATLMRWPGGFGFFLGTTDGEVWASFDKGESWVRIVDRIAPISKCVHHRNLEMGRAAARASAQG